jgi:hypothetical protein
VIHPFTDCAQTLALTQLVRALHSTRPCPSLNFYLEERKYEGFKIKGRQDQKIREFLEKETRQGGAERPSFSLFLRLAK